MTAPSTASGTVGQTLDVISVIEKAVRKCGVLPSVLSDEQLHNARESLLLLLIGLSNRGVNLWAVEKRTLAPGAGQARLPLGVDYVDIKTANYRTGSYSAATSYPANAALLDFGSAVQIDSATVASPSGSSLSLALENSSDGISWSPNGTMAHPSVQVGQLYGVDADIGVSARYWRLRDTTALLTFTAANFVYSSREVPMSQFDLTTYSQQPMKLTVSGQPLQYFFDKQTPAPQLWLWPTLNSVGPQIVLWIQRQLQDVGALTKTLDLPSRWLTPIIYKLAADIILEFPKELVIDGRPEQLVARAETEMRLAEDGEVDGAPLRLMPAIACYTRG